MAKKPISNFVTQLPAIISIDLELHHVGIWDALQDLEYESQNEIENLINTT
jgi:hypothetical protein